MEAFYIKNFNILKRLPGSEVEYGLNLIKEQ